MLSCCFYVWAIRATSIFLCGDRSLHFCQCCSFVPEGLDIILCLQDPPRAPQPQAQQRQVPARKVRKHGRTAVCLFSTSSACDSLVLSSRPEGQSAFQQRKIAVGLKKSRRCRELLHKGVTYELFRISCKVERQAVRRYALRKLPATKMYVNINEWLRWWK